MCCGRRPSPRCEVERAHAHGVCDELYTCARPDVLDRWAVLEGSRVHNQPANKHALREHIVNHYMVYCSLHLFIFIHIHIYIMLHIR